MPSSAILASDTGTLYAALILATFTASIGLLGFLGKSLVEFARAIIEERRLYRTAVIRFYNDVKIWQRDFRITYTESMFNRLADMVVEGPDDFKFATPSSDAEDYVEIMKFIHRMDVEQARLIRTFIIYSELLTSVSRILGSELERFDKRRKLHALANFRETAEFVLLLSDEVIERMERNLYLRLGNARINALLAKQSDFHESAAKFAKSHIDRLLPPGAATRDQRSGGSGPDMVDLREFIKLVHKITSAYRKFKP